MEQLHTLTAWVSTNAWNLLTDTVTSCVIVLVAVLARAGAGRLITRLMNRVQRANTRAHTWNSKLHNGHANQHERQVARVRTIGNLLRSAASVLIFGVAIVMILAQFGINVGPIIASAGVVGLAIGFGAQSLVKDIIAGIFIMAEDQYGVGDVVNVGSAFGTVEGVTLRIVKIRDLDGGLWYLRNGEIASLCNMSQEWANSVVEVPLDPEVEMAKAKGVIEHVSEQFAANSTVAADLLEPPVLAGVTNMGNGAVTVRILTKTTPGAQWTVGRALREAPKEAFDQEGIKLAVPRVLPAPGNG